jgi:hypothetical protein
VNKNEALAKLLVRFREEAQDIVADNNLDGSITFCLVCHLDENAYIISNAKSEGILNRLFDAGFSIYVDASKMDKRFNIDYNFNSN